MQKQKRDLKCCLQSHSLLALDSQMKHSFSFALSTVGYLDFWVWKSQPLSVISDLFLLKTKSLWFPYQKEFVFSFASNPWVNSSSELM